ncbi:SCO7613 C-terminal domain-containing membrane protein [Microbacterium sp.]|uniref:SCO7613 C-terminal domain-containing membrane protein n=1 Tax=Microbacterium sp. TaxID=51671 RepID=UPI003F9E4406
MSATTETISWSESIARQLLDSATCPVCGFEHLDGGCCGRCGADLRGTHGTEVWNASIAAAAALRSRDALLSRVPRVSAIDAAPPAPTQTPALASPSQPTLPPRSSATVQSVLAIAGAGLFAIAALIFTFLNPDLSDRGIRSVVVGLVSLVFLGGAWFLARRGLQFSAEAVGALGLVFVGLDIYAFAQVGSGAAATWLLAALATALAGALMLAAGRISQITVWAWGALLGIALVPAMLGYAAGSPFVSALGHLGSAFLAAALVEKWPLVGQRSLTALQLIAVLSAIPLAVLGAFSFANTAVMMLAVSAIFALIAVHAVFASRHLLRGWWSLVVGAASTTALVLAVSSPVAQYASEWLPAAVPTAAAFAFAVVAAAPAARTVLRSARAVGGVLVLGMISLVPFAMAAATAMDAVASVMRGRNAVVNAEPWNWAPSLGMLGIAAGLALFGILARARLRVFAAVTDAVAIGAAGVAVLMVGCASLLVLPARLALLLGVAGVASIALRTMKPLREAPAVNRAVLLIGIHAAIVVGLLISWLDPRTAPLAGVGVIAALALAGSVLPARARFVHIGAGFAYALVCAAQALGQTALGSVAVLCLVASAGLITAIIVTFLPRVRARDWYAVLGVASIPFVAGIVQVVFERSGWTALSTSLMFALSLSLLLTRRPGLGIVLRTAASAMLVPTVAVVVVCLGAQVLAVSASPVTLPIIAALVALVLPSTTLIRDALRRNGLSADAATAARAAIESSALLTGAIAVVLALARDAAGLGTTFLVLVILGVGAAGSAIFTHRRYGWWVAGAAFTGALWCVWTMNGVDLLEAYLLPPALAAVLTAVILAARAPNRNRLDVRGLYAAGLGVAIVPSLVLLVIAPADAGDGVGVPWRAIALLAAGGVLLGVGARLAPQGRKLAPQRREGERRRLASLAPATFVAAGVAAVAGPVQGIRLGLGVDGAPLHGAGLFAVCFAASGIAAIILLGAGHGIRSRARAGSRVRRTRWLFAPAVFALAGGTWCAIERDWASIWLMWALMIGILALMLASALRARRTALPPVWFLFGLAFVTAVVAWSPRDLRVEWFSLPLGAFLLLAGIHGLRQSGVADGARWSTWPAGRTGSWPLLGPGIITMMSASIVATFTDPLTWRAILVMVLALVAIMAGAAKRLAAPFILGMLVLPIENVFVFAVQIGRGIESMPWWITLAVIGAVLLIIAVTYERRNGAADTMVARLRDLS